MSTTARAAERGDILRPDASVRPAGRARPYLDPYLAGMGIGLVLLAAYALVGRGLGASGGFASIATAGAAAAGGAARTASNPAFSPYFSDGAVRPLQDWLVLELIGVMLGAGLSAWRAGRFALRLDTAGTARSTRLASALAGGLVMGFGAKLARGCTSGQALTGGALLSVGSWVFIIACFAGGYASAPLLRRLWP